MNYWLTTDTHFNHDKLIEYGRPKDFESRIKKQLISLVRKNDILIHLGDVCIGNDKNNNNWFKENLNCKAWLVRGNHDNKSIEWYLKNGWDVCVDRFDIKMFGKRIAFTHKPEAWDGYFDVNIHGHFHATDGRRHEDFNEKILSGYNKLLALEYTGYKPINLNKFINK